MSDAPTMPLQARSRATLERILQATEQLLEDRLFEQVGIAEIAAAAGISVGTVYTRFKTKSDMLPTLFERYSARVREPVEELVDELENTGRLPARVDLVVAAIVEHHRRNRGILRALTLYARANPDTIPRDIARERVVQYRSIAGALAGDGTGIRHDEPLAAASFGVFLVGAGCRDRILFGDATLATPVRQLSIAQLERELCRVLRMYLSGTAR